MSDHPLVRQMLAGMRVVFWLAATLFGSGGVVCTLASFTRPQAGAHAVAFLLLAMGLLYARDQTPK